MTKLPQRATVSAFDEARGWGEVTVSEGKEAGAVFPFHCTAVLDGSRRIGVGTAVVIIVVPGHRGQLEATALSPLP